MDTEARRKLNALLESNTEEDFKEVFQPETMKEMRDAVRKFKLYNKCQSNNFDSFEICALAGAVDKFAKELKYDFGISKLDLNHGINGLFESMGEHYPEAALILMYMLCHLDDAGSHPLDLRYRMNNKINMNTENARLAVSPEDMAKAEESGVVQIKPNGSWGIISMAKGEWWDANYSSEDAARSALKAYHARSHHSREVDSVDRECNSDIKGLFPYKSEIRRFRTKLDAKDIEEIEVPIKNIELSYRSEYFSGDEEGKYTEFIRDVFNHKITETVDTYDKFGHRAGSKRIEVYISDYKTKDGTPKLGDYVIFEESDRIYAGILLKVVNAFYDDLYYISGVEYVENRNYKDRYFCVFGGTFELSIGPATLIHKPKLVDKESVDKMVAWVKSHGKKYNSRGINSVVPPKDMQVADQYIAHTNNDNYLEILKKIANEIGEHFDVRKSFNTPFEFRDWAGKNPKISDRMFLVIDYILGAVTGMKKGSRGRNNRQSNSELSKEYIKELVDKDGLISLPYYYSRFKIKYKYGIGCGRLLTPIEIKSPDQWGDEEIAYPIYKDEEGNLFDRSNEGVKNCQYVVYDTVTKKLIGEHDFSETKLMNSRQSNSMDYTDPYEEAYVKASGLYKKMKAPVPGDEDYADEDDYDFIAKQIGYGNLSGTEYDSVIQACKDAYEDYVEGKNSRSMNAKQSMPTKAQLKKEYGGDPDSWPIDYMLVIEDSAKKEYAKAVKDFLAGNDAEIPPKTSVIGVINLSGIDEALDSDKLDDFPFGTNRYLNPDSDYYMQERCRFQWEFGDYIVMAGVAYEGEVAKFNKKHPDLAVTIEKLPSDFKFTNSRSMNSHQINSNPPRSIRETLDRSKLKLTNIVKDEDTSAISFQYKDYWFVAYPSVAMYGIVLTAEGPYGEGISESYKGNALNAITVNAFNFDKGLVTLYNATKGLVNLNSRQSNSSDNLDIKKLIDEWDLFALPHLYSRFKIKFEYGAGSGKWLTAMDVLEPEFQKPGPFGSKYKDESGSIIDRSREGSNDAFFEIKDSDTDKVIGKSEYGEDTVLLNSRQTNSGQKIPSFEIYIGDERYVIDDAEVQEFSPGERYVGANSFGDIAEGDDEVIDALVSGRVVELRWNTEEDFENGERPQILTCSRPKNSRQVNSDLSSNISSINKLVADKGCKAIWDSENDRIEIVGQQVDLLTLTQEGGKYILSTEKEVVYASSDYDKVIDELKTQLG